MIFFIDFIIIRLYIIISIIIKFIAFPNWKDHCRFSIIKVNFHTNFLFLTAIIFTIKFNFPTSIFLNSLCLNFINIIIPAVLYRLKIIIF